jgi:phospholipase/carboxylesterase
MTQIIQVQQPNGPSDHLFVLLHGVGATPEDMAPLGNALAAAFELATVVCVPGRHASSVGRGFEWFSVNGITEESRPARVADAMPDFKAAIKWVQANLKMSAAATTLVGFSQGGIMALESTRAAPSVAAHVVSLSARFATPPEQASGTGIHLLHGQNDPVIAPQFSVSAAERLKDLGADVTLDLIPHLGHSVDRAEVTRLIDRLRAAFAKRSL